jgi:Tfp pilus assembly major pilin PilA
MSTTLIKILVAIGAILLCGALAFIIYNQVQIKNQQTAIQTQIVQQQQLVDGIVRSQSQYATSADLSKFASDSNLNLKAIKDNLDTLNAKVASINVVTATSQGQTATHLPSTGTGPTNPNPNPVDPANPDPFGYMKAQQNLTLNEDFGTLKVPFGTVGFSAWQKEPWDINVSPREYNVDTVVGVDDHERQYFYNKFTVKVADKTYDVPIKTATTKQQVPSATWSWWNPRLLMGLDGGVNITNVKGEFTPHVDIGIMSYGQYKTTPDFSILEVGVGYGTINKTGQVVVTPVAYNIGRNLFSPLMNNTYIGPSLSIGTDGSIGAGAGVRVGF